MLFTCSKSCVMPVFFQNFLALCASNYYNGCVFHRNIKGFIVQTGDPAGIMFLSKEFLISLFKSIHVFLHIICYCRDILQVIIQSGSCCYSS